MHYYNFHIGDYKSHTHHLSPIEDIAFRRLLDLYYMTEKPIIADQAARLIGMREYGDDVLCVLVEFFEETELGYINKRADEEISAYRAKVEQASSAGKRSAEKRLNGRKTSVSNPINERPTDVQLTNNQEPITNNQDKNIPPDGGIDLKSDLFECAKTIGIKASMIGKAIKEVGEIEAMAALEQSQGQESPINAFAASIRNRKAKIEAAGEAAEILKPKLFNPAVLSI